MIREKINKYMFILKCLLSIKVTSFTIILLFSLLLNESVLAQNVSSGLPEKVLPAGMGVDIHFVVGGSTWAYRQNIAANGDNSVNLYMLDMMAAAGFKFIRMDMYWEYCEQAKGVYTWWPYDTLVKELNQRGIRALFTLGYNDTLYAKSLQWGPQDSTNIAAYAAFAAAAVKHFEGNHIIWEIWNEPNNTINWLPVHNALQYANLVIAASKAMRKVNPNATIVAPAMAGIQLDVLDSLFKAGILNYINGVTLHPYRDNPPPPELPETVGPDFKDVRALIDQYEPPGDTIPIISGEWGYSTTTLTSGVSRQTQADYFARMQLFNLYSGVPLTMWYDWKDDGKNLDKIGQNRGFVDYYLVPKPSYIAATVLSRELSDYHVNFRYDDGIPSDVILVLKNSQDSIKIAAWTEGFPHQVTFPLSALSLPDTTNKISWVSTNAGAGTINVISSSFKDSLSSTPKFYSTFKPVSAVPVPTVPALYLPAASTTGLVRTPILKWNASFSYFSITYRVQIATDSSVNSDGSFNAQNVVFDTTISDTAVQLSQPLNSSKTYYWHASAVNLGGESNYSLTRSFETGIDISIPLKPVNVTPALLETNVPRLANFSWSASSYAQEYELQIATDYHVYLSGDSVGMFIAQNVVLDTTIADTLIPITDPLNSNTTYFWHVSAKNTAGASGYSASWKFTTGTDLTLVKETSGTPKTFDLSQNFPNPFNPTTIIRYSVPKTSRVIIKVFDILGREVTTLVNSMQEPGTYHVEFNGSRFATGVYFFRMIASGYANIHKMILIK
ncbi:MAG: cellulase family glycosylhydrolase [Ignavibacteriaceae bacterium]